MKPSYWDAKCSHVSNCCIAALWLYSKDYRAFTETIPCHRKLPSVLEVVGHVWLLLPMITTSPCSTYVTGVWLQQQPKDSMVFIHRLPGFSWDKTFNLFMNTTLFCLVKFSSNVIKWQGGIGAAVTCTSNVLIRIWFVFLMNVSLNLAMPSDASEFIAVGESILPMSALSRTSSEVVQS